MESDTETFFDITKIDVICPFCKRCDKFYRIGPRYICNMCGTVFTEKDIVNGVDKYVDE